MVQDLQHSEVSDPADDEDEGSKQVEIHVPFCFSH